MTNKTNLNQKKYKIDFIEKTITVYCIDVLANNEEEAKQKAELKMQSVLTNGTYHYYEVDKDETVPELSTIYDVTNTDDPFNP